MYRLFNTNSPISFVLLFFVVLLMHAFQISDEPVPTSATTSPVWDYVFGGLTTGSAGSIVLSTLTLVVMTYFVNSMTSTFRFVEHPNALGGFYFALLTASAMPVSQFRPEYLFAILSFFAIYRLFRGATVERNMRHNFEAALIVSIAVLFYPKGILVIPLLFVGSLLLRVVSPRSFAAAVLGAVLPFAIAAVYSFWTGSLATYFDIYSKAAIEHVEPQRPPLFLRIYYILVLTVLAYAIFVVLSNLGRMKIVESLHARSMQWLAIVTIALYFTPFFDCEVLLLLAFSASMLIASSMQRTRSTLVVEIATIALFAMSFFAQFYA